MIGIYFDTNDSMWRAQIYFHGRKIDLGRFDGLEDAEEALIQAKRIYSNSPRNPPRPPNIFDTCQN
jgi:hypothetical protein